jgi:hypothetical protein
MNETAPMQRRIPVKRWLVISALVVGLAWLIVDRHRRGTSDVATVPETAGVEFKMIDVAGVIDYREMTSPTFRVRTTRDMLPGGMSAAMAPVLVVWDQSDFSPGGTVTIRNVNHGGNPVSGVTVLRTAVIHSDRVLRAEYIAVPLGGPDAISHGQVRFVFADGGAELVGGDPATVGVPDSLTDLVLSWEAWRPPRTDYNVLTGLEPGSYHLTMRAYSGVQRFLEDALQQRDWNVYPLKLPGGRSGATELLKVCLAMGDGAARYTLSDMLVDTKEERVRSEPDTTIESGDAAEAWRKIGASMGGARTAGDERIDLKGLTGYQSALRSCATMALYEINVATARLIERGYPHEGMNPVKQSIRGDPEWMVELAGASIAEVFLRAPQAIGFIRRNPAAIPSEIPGMLGEAGLLEREDGKIVKRRFTISGETPWGPANQLLIK